MTINIADLIGTYIEMRDTVAQMDAEAKAATKPLKDAMADIELRIKAHLNETGQSSASVKGVGTAYKTTRVSSKVADWGAAFEHIKEHDLWHMIEHRVSKTAVQEYMAVHGEPPPGVDVTTSIEVNIQRS